MSIDRRPDHLNTPRAVYDDQQQLRWKWDQAEPFGVTTPDENPVNLGAFELPLRFPGQHFDKEDNLAYNHFRDYDSAIGRYAQSDPIGLKGGLNTYVYVNGQPLAAIDSRGLASISVDVNAHGFIAALGAKSSFGLAFGSNVCFKVETCGRGGVGGAAQINAALGYNSGDLCTQVVESTGVFASGGPFLGGLSSVKGSGALSVSFGGGIGGGMAIGAEACRTQYFCLLKKPCNSCQAEPARHGMSEIMAP